MRLVQHATISSSASSDWLAIIRAIFVPQPWLRIIAASGCLDKKRLDPLIGESLELTRMMGASVATARRKLEQEGDMEI